MAIFYKSTICKKNIRHIIFYLFSLFFCSVHEELAENRRFHKEQYKKAKHKRVTRFVYLLILH